MKHVYLAPLLVLGLVGCAAQADIGMRGSAGPTGPIAGAPYGAPQRGMQRPPHNGGPSGPRMAGPTDNPCEPGYQWYPGKNQCIEHHEPRFVQKARCTPGEKTFVPDTSHPGGKRELTCGFVASGMGSASNGPPSY